MALEQTVTLSPCECYVINLQLRPGAFVAGLPLNPVMTLVEADGQVIAFYAQNELTKVQPATKRSSRSRRIRAASSRARSTRSCGPSARASVRASGTIRCRRSRPAPGILRREVRPAERDRQLFLAAGAVGDAAIYTQYGEMLHVRAQGHLRVGSYTNYLILKLH
jgi:hypothetical protein